MSLQVAATFPDEISATIACGMLENNGIPAIVSDTAMSNIYPMPYASVSAVRLLVHPDNLEKAQELLKQHHDSY